VEDNNLEGLKLKQHLVKYLSEDDTRTFGVCIGIKMRRKSEVFCSILVRKRPLIKIGSLGLINVYDILCAKDFNPNERTGFAYSTGNPKLLLAEQLRRAILSFYKYRKEENIIAVIKGDVKDAGVLKEEWVYQCKSCLAIYDEEAGDAENGIDPGTPFYKLPEDYVCATCEEPKTNFVKIKKVIVAS
jgi:rubredoxin